MNALKKNAGKKFWSTKDAGSQPFTYQAGMGRVIVGWDQVWPMWMWPLRMCFRVRTRAPILKPKFEHRQSVPAQLCR